MKNSSTSVCFEANRAQKDIGSRLLVNCRRRKQANAQIQMNTREQEGAESLTSLSGSKDQTLLLTQC